MITNDQLEADSQIDDSTSGGVELNEFQTPEVQANWLKEFEAARKERDNFDKSGVKTIDRYAGIFGAKDNTHKYNLFTANTEIKLSALYSRTPQPDIRRRDMAAGDDAGRVAANLLQRAVAMELDTDSGDGTFDTVFKQVLFDRLVPGMGVGWVRLEETYEPKRTETKTRQVPVLDALGTPVLNEGQPVLTTEEYEETIPEQLIEQNTPIDYVAWDDILWAPSPVWTMCRWIARRTPMSKDACAGRFGKTASAEVLAGLSYEAKKSDDKSGSGSSKSKNNTHNTTDIYEVWDKETRRIYWISETATVPLDVKDDSNKFPGFYPTPLPPLGRFTTSSTIPRSDYSLAQDLYQSLDELQEKAWKLIECLKAVGAYDSSKPELKDILNAEPNTMVPVKDFTMWMNEKGGLMNSMALLDTSKYSEILAQTLNQIGLVKQQIYEVEGIADFMRGETQAYDSAAAITQKGKFAPNRLGTQQKEVAKYVERLIQLKTHLISKFYKPEILVDHAGSIPDADKKYLAEAVRLLKSNFQANFRLSVSVDSIQDSAWRVEQEERTAVVRTIGGLIQQIGPMVQQQPDLAPLAIELIRYVVAGTKGSDPVEGVLDANLQKMLESLSKGEGQQKPPSKEEIKAQAAQQHDQMDFQKAREKNQTELAIAQSEAQSRFVNDQQELEIGRMNAQVNAVEAQAKIITAAHKQAHDMSRPA